MADVKWTPQSLEDVEDIALFIARDSEKYAKLQVHRFFLKTEILQTQPFAGRIVPEIGKKTIRELIQGNYRIIYKIVNANRIDILTVHHSRRLLTNNPVFR